MTLRSKLDAYKGIETVWGGFIPEKEAYTYALRHIAAFSANVFQAIRIMEPNYEKRATKLCETGYAMNMMSSGPENLKTFHDEWNIPEFCERTAWLGAIFGDFGDEYQNMSGRVVQFTPQRVEKELDMCPWDIVGSEICNMAIAQFKANFDACGANGEHDEMYLNMCEARGCGDMHCRVVAERRSVYAKEKQDWLEHMQPAADECHVTPRERMFTEGQLLRNGLYSNAFGEEKTLEWAYNWSMQMSWCWSIGFPLIAVKSMDFDQEEFARVFKVVCATAGKNAFIEPFATVGMRAWLKVPKEIGDNDGRLMGGYIKAQLDTQLLSNELLCFDEEEVRIRVETADLVSRVPMFPIEELLIGHEVLWHNMVKTMVGAEWSCWFENKDDGSTDIVVAKKVDKRMV